MRFGRFPFAVLLSSLLTLGAVAAPADVLFVVIGGRDSCGGSGPNGIGMAGPFESLRQKLKGGGPEVHYVMVCLTTSPPPDGQLQYVLSDESTATKQGTGATLMNEIERMSLEKSVEAVFVVGHSYGGWLSMYMAERLRQKGSLLLFTVDPISTQCGPFEVVTGSKKCKQAPTDRDNAKIKAASRRWVNFYQNQDSWIQSGPVTEAENHHITYRGPHSNIDGDARTWKEIEAVATAELGL